MRFVWMIGGFLALALALIGIPLPLLPTVPFLLLAAFCFARSSDRLHDWLIGHPRFGPPITEWRERGAISKPAKLAATLAMIAAFGIAALAGVAHHVLVIQVAVLACVGVFIWSRPEA